MITEFGGGDGPSATSVTGDAAMALAPVAAAERVGLLARLRWLLPPMYTIGPWAWHPWSRWPRIKKVGTSHIYIHWHRRMVIIPRGWWR